MLLGGISLVSLLAAVGFCWNQGAFAGADFLWLLPVSFLVSCLALMLLAFGFLWLMCALVDLNKPQEHDSRFYRKMMHLYISALARLVGLKVRTKGMELVPKQGRFLLVCNHLGLADPVILLHYFRKSQLAFITKKENQSMFLVGKAMHKILCQPIDRENDRAELKTILKCIDLLRNDQVSIAVFPEGYVSLSGELLPFRSGVFRIAQKAKVPIVVCTLRNAEHVIPNITRLESTSVDLHLVGVIGPEEFEGQNTTQIAERVHQMMEEDLNDT